jgi:hypothetical protein
MSDIPASDLATVNNPIPTTPGPDFHVRQYLHGRFNFHAKSGRIFNPDVWTDWSEEEIAEVVRCVAKDFLDAEGAGYDWLSAAERAEFLIAGLYNEVASDSGNWPAPLMRVNFYDPFFEEGIELDMGPPLDIEMDPIPGVEAPPAPTDSVRSQASLRLRPTGNAMLAADKALVEGVKQLSAFFDNQGRLPLIMTGGILTLWKGLQVSHQVRAGAIWRGIHNPGKPEVRMGDMQVLYGRSSARIHEAARENPDAAQLFLS